MKTFTVMSIVIALSIYTAWQIAYGQENEVTKEANRGILESKTLEDCYKNTLTAMVTETMNHKPLSNILLIITNPDVKQAFIDSCNFIHEKTGVWYWTGNSTEKYGMEFIQKYPIPEQLRVLMEENK